jgi:molybdopterin converting factor small subunit
VQVTVKLFSILRVRVGKPELRVEIAEGATAADLFAALEEIYGEDFFRSIKSKDGHYAISVRINGKAAPPEELLHEGDVVSLIGVLSGG